MKRALLWFIISLLPFASLGQPRSYLSVTGGVGLHSRVYTPDRLNYFKSRQPRPQIGIQYDRTGKSGWGWQIGLAYRETLLNTDASLETRNGPSLPPDTFRSFHKDRFVLVPIAINYTKTLDKFQVGASVGGYAGWHTYGVGWLEINDVYTIPFRVRTGSRFPRFDTIGADAGIFVAYNPVPKLRIKLEGRANRDVTELLKSSSFGPTPIALTSFHGYRSTLFLLSIGYRLK